MDGILGWGYDVVRWFQQFSPALDALFQGITMLGSGEVFLLLLPLVFWCVDKRRGLRLGALLLLSAHLNYALKELFNQPRPAPERVKVLYEATGPGLPSGHSQNSVAVYGYLAIESRRRWLWGVAGLVALAVGVSRVYLGVHFPSDVLAGWAIGLGVLWVYGWGVPRMERLGGRWTWWRRMVGALGVPLVLFLVYANESSAQLMGALAGLLGGALVEGRWVRFDPGGPWRKRVVRFMVGVVVLVALWLGSSGVVPDSPTGLALGGRFVRYALVSAWASLGGPWLFVRAGLAPRQG